MSQVGQAPQVTSEAAPPMVPAASDRWGTKDGARHRILSSAVMAAAAFAPWIGTLLASLRGSNAAAMVVLVRPQPA